MRNAGTLRDQSELVGGRGQDYYAKKDGKLVLVVTTVPTTTIFSLI